MLWKYSTNQEHNHTQGANFENQTTYKVATVHNWAGNSQHQRAVDSGPHYFLDETDRPFLKHPPSQL